MPSDMGLLALVALYTEGAVPSAGIIPVLSFLASHTGVDSAKESSSPQACWQKAQDDIHLVNSVKAFETLLLPFPAAIGVPGRRLWDLFVAKLWAIDSLDALHEFFDTQATLLATKDEIRLMVEPEDGVQSTRVPLMSNSPLAMFVRRAHLEFNRLHFEDASNLWKDFIVYRHPTASAWTRRKPSSSPARFDSVLDISEPDWGEGAPSIEFIAYGDLSSVRASASVHCLDGLIEFQVAQMQSESTCGRCYPRPSADKAVVRIWSSRATRTPTAVLDSAECQPGNP